MNNKEKRGIYNVTFNDKNSTPINTDLEVIENAIIDYVFYYVKGFHNPYRDRGLGAEHIKLHLESGSKREITIEELLNLGNSIREYLKNFDEPFIDENGARIYEWENDKGARFRVITDKIGEKNLDKVVKDYQRGGTQLPLSPSDNQIISFYSDRNFNQRMEFKNPKVKEYYENLHNLSQQNPKTTLQNIHNKLESLNQDLQIQKEQFNNAFTLKQESLKDLEQEKYKHDSQSIKEFNKIERKR